MAKARAAEKANLRSCKPESVRGSPGFFRVGRTRAGQWWLLDPEGRPCFSRGVGVVNRWGRAGPSPAAPAGWAAEAGEPVPSEAEELFAREARLRLRQWQVNTLGPWAGPGLAEAGFFLTVSADFRRAGGPVIHQQGVHLPDVFDPGWPAVSTAHAALVTAPWIGRTALIGYYTDDALGWGETRADRPGLLQICLSLEPGFAVYHAAWEFVLAPHAGSLAALGRAWGLVLPHREVVRQHTLAEQPVATAGFRRDQERFAREFSLRYFRSVAEALRRCDPGHLILGCRFAEPPGTAVLAGCVYPQVDVVSWRGRALAAEAGFYAKAASMPQLLIGVGTENGRPLAMSVLPRSGPSRAEGLLRDERQALAAACVHPAVVGYEWGRWADEPDDVPPFGSGLVHADGREAFEHSEAFARINAQAETRRWRAGGA